VKGLAIVGVLLIHARPLVGTWFHARVVNEAVPVLLVLFGTTSELWWRREAARSSDGLTARWYRARAGRLLVPVWSALAVLWSIRFAVGLHTTSPLHVLLTFAGYMPWVGTGWFVTLALELVVLFPLMQWTFERLGTVLSLAVAAMLLVWSESHVDLVITLMSTVLHDQSTYASEASYYYLWIFPPARMLMVVAGMVLARQGMPSRRVGAAAAAIVVIVGAIADRLGTDPLAERLTTSLLGIPLALALLVAVRTFDGRVGAGLAWLGRHSWGAYLGQLIAHEAIHAFASPDEASVAVRWAYFGVLLGSAVLLVVVGEQMRRRVVPRLAGHVT